MNKAPGQPLPPSVREYLLFVLSKEGQQVVAKDGYPIDFPYTVDTLNVAPGERYSVLVQIDRPGAWVWHCHILPHVENDQRMFGMVTAVVVS